MDTKEIEKLETMVWQGEDSFEHFAFIASELGYKFIVKCMEDENQPQQELGAACKDDSELIDMLEDFSELNYNFQIQRL